MIISPNSSFKLSELSGRHEILFFLVWKEIRVRYKQTLFGILWTILVPAINAGILGIIFGKVAKLTPDGINPFLYYFAALVPWQLFAGSLTSTSNSLVANAPIITKVYIPKLLFPISACFTRTIDYLISFVILCFCLQFFDQEFTLSMLFIPILVAWIEIIAFGVGLILACINVRFRDIALMIPFILRIWMYCSVIIPFETVIRQTSIFAKFYYWNPLAFIAECHRWCLLKSLPSYANVSEHLITSSNIIACITFTIIVLAVAYNFLVRTDKIYADII